ncbi:MAG TPA: hypothetical protein VLC92_21335 [Rhodocyclaceae bacterium]|nr:hypothetical protein [Rhodocyclaceae bacterium]
MQTKFKNLLWVVLACALVACGGGGGGDGGSAPSAPVQNGNFDLSTNSLSFTAATPLSTVAAQTVTMSNVGPDAAVIKVSSTSGGAIPTWLSIVISGSSATVTANPSALPMGTYQSVVRVASQNSSGQQLSYKDVNVQLTVTTNTWSIYDATALPDATGAVTLADGTSSRFFLCGNSAGTASGNCKSANNTVAAGILTVDSTAAAADTNSYYLRDALPNGYPKSVTTVFRTRATAPFSGLSVVLNLGETGGNNGGRVQIFIEDPTFAPGGLVIWNTDTSNPSLVPPQHVVATGITTTSYHTYQMTTTLTNATTGFVRVYVDGAATPVINQSFTTLGQATAGTNQNSIGIGEISSNATGKFDLDWIVWTSGAYTPAQLSGKLPASLGVTTGY